MEGMLLPVITALSPTATIKCASSVRNMAVAAHAGQDVARDAGLPTLVSGLRHPARRAARTRFRMGACETSLRYPLLLAGVCAIRGVGPAVPRLAAEMSRRPRPSRRSSRC